MRNYFSETFRQFESYFSSIEHEERSYLKTNSIKAFNKPMDEMFYIRAGTIAASSLHESGHIKAFSFYGEGYLAPLYFPGTGDEFRALSFDALTELDVYVFERKKFLRYLQGNQELNDTMYSAYIDLVGMLLIENINQLFSSGMEKICNFFYMYLENGEKKDHVIDLSQNQILEFVGLNRANLAKYLKILREQGIISTYRNQIEVKDILRLREYCSAEEDD
ncbi:MAG: Crp/Fnr family transcriptional regulator [Anaerofustis sp.]